MKTDKFTKIIMTVIAVALVKIAFQDTQAIKPLFAHNGEEVIHKIALCDTDGWCADVVEDGDGLLGLRTSQKFPLNLTVGR